MGVVAVARKPFVLLPSAPGTLGSLPAGLRLYSACTVGLMPSPRGSHAKPPLGPHAVEVARLYCWTTPELSWNSRTPERRASVGTMWVTTCPAGKRRFS